MPGRRLLAPDLIRGLRLPAAQKGQHLKGGAGFTLNHNGPKAEVINTTSLPARAIAKGKIKDVFCKPSFGSS